MSLVKVAGNASGTGTITIQAPNTNTNYTVDLPAAAGTIQLSGNAISGTTGTFSGTISGGSTIGVGGATPSASGAGITFPATQSASSDANTLDDYEEGTWTPTVTFGGNSAGQSYNTRAGFYTKIGRYVFASCYVDFSNKGSSTGNALITGLPFTSSSSAGANAGGSVVGYTTMASIAYPMAQVANNSASITLRNGGATTDPQMTDANFNPGLIVCSVHYFV